MGHTIQDDKQLLERASNITCVSDYLDVLSYVNVIRKNNNLSISKTLFFRGYSDASWRDEPSIYRKDIKSGKSLIAYETELFYEIVSRCPDDFRHCRTALDHLVMMQHYGLPTRLLDITENPLVALYFACKNEGRKTDAQVAIYDIWNRTIKNYNSDRAAMLANLAKIDITEFSVLIFDCDEIVNDFIKYFNDYKALVKVKGNIFTSEAYSYFEMLLVECREWMQKDLKKGCVVKVFLNEVFNILDTEKILNVISQEAQDQIRSTFFDLHNEFIKIPKVDDYFNRARYIIACVSKNKIVHLIQEEKPYFEVDNINFHSFESVIVVKTKQDNPNIIKQNGSFFLFGVSENCLDKIECAQVPQEYYLGIGEDQKNKVACIIKPEYKKNILDELDSLSISESQLFPNIKDTANYLTNKYKEKYINN